MKKAAVLLVVLLAGAAFVPVGGEEPATVTVARGDTLGKLATDHGVALTDLRAWNGLDGDLIQVGQELRLGDGAGSVPLWMVAAERVGALLAREPMPAPEEVAVVSPPEGKRPRTPRGTPPDRGLWQDDQGRWIDAQGRFTNAQGQPIDEDGNVIEDTTRTWAPLRMPPPKECVDAFAGTEGGGENAFGRSQGLSGGQVSQAVAAFQEQTLRCSDGTSGQVQLELDIGCDGRVQQARVLDDGTGFGGCVADVMRHAPFPAHARDTVTVQVPLRFD